ncbi:hypothetical protein CcaverHIS002_0402040 [Cutaneotrichosporon cavernicola]|nr:hypothetical protein CcaverHIS002_0402040 [Cutaneotrichosporon cavernicola]
MSDIDTKHEASHIEAPLRESKSGLFKNAKIVGITSLATLGGFLFGYDQGVVGNVLALQRFGADFPRVYMDANIKGWFVSSLLLGAWFGSLLSGPLCDKLGRKRSIMFQVLVFTLGSALQTGARVEAHMFAGRIIAGLSIGSLTHIVPMYIAELAPAAMRGALVALQQLSITLGILFSYWIAYGTSHIGGTRCSDIPYSGPKGPDGHATFDAYNDVPAGGCTGQSQAAWRVPVGIQILPGLILGIGMFFMPYSPRWLVEVGRDDEAKATLSRLRSLPIDDPDVVREFVEIKAEVITIRQIRETRGTGKSGLARALQPYVELLSTKSNFHRLYIGCTTMFFQQFIGCNAIIYYAPTIFAQLGMDPNTTSLLATGVYGITNTLFTLPAVFFLDRVGRRKLLMVGRVAIAFVYIYDVFFSFSWAPIGWVLPSEIFNLATRSTAVSITTSTTSPHGGTYFFFAGFAVLGFISTYFFLPETRRVALEDMDAIWGAKTSDEDRHIADTVLREIEQGEDAKRGATV